jgi:hypothetical protein
LFANSAGDRKKSCSGTTCENDAFGEHVLDLPQRYLSM